MITGLLIETEKCKIRTVELDPNEEILEQIYEHLLINNSSRLAQMVPLAKLSLPWNDCLIFDEEGRLNSSAKLGEFSLGLPRASAGRAWIAGRALVLRLNKHGRFVTPKLRLGVLQTYVEWSKSSTALRLVHSTGGRA